MPIITPFFHFERKVTLNPRLEDQITGNILKIYNCSVYCCTLDVWKLNRFRTCIFTMHHNLIVPVSIRFYCDN